VIRQASFGEPDAARISRFFDCLTLTAHIAQRTDLELLVDYSTADLALVRPRGRN
jgi:hypothetical protein